MSGVCLKNNKMELRLETWNLKHMARKAVFLSATVCFVAMVTALPLQLHLSDHEHGREHDSDHCSVCRQLLVAPGKFISEPELSLPESNLQEDKIEFQSQSYVTALHCKPFDPRPPPNRSSS